MSVRPVTTALPILKNFVTMQIVTETWPTTDSHVALNSVLEISGLFLH